MRYLIALALLALAPDVQAKLTRPTIGECHPYAEVVATLALYGEIGTGPTFVNSGSAVETFISLVRGSVTVVEVFASGQTCYRAFGESWGKPPTGANAL